MKKQEKKKNKHGVLKLMSKRVDSSDLDQKTGYEDSLVQTKSILAVSRVLIM